MALTTFVASQVLTAQELNDSFAAVGGARAVVPTSVTVTGGGSSGTVGANGTVTFGTAASVSINGCFSSAFRNYRIICDFDASTTMNVDIRLRVAGTDNSTANSYSAQQVTGNGTGTGAARTTSTLLRIGSAASTSTNGVSIDAYRPFLADSTAFITHSIDSTSQSYLTVIAGTHNQDVSYDGFTIIPSTGSISDTVTIYGYFG